VFVGGCTLEAAEGVCATPTGAQPLGLDVFGGLGALLDHSLVWQREETDGAARFGMLQVIREYALERLEASGEVAVLHQAHLTYFLALAQELEPRFEGPEPAAWLAVLERERDNCRAALAWAYERGHTESEAAERGWRLGTALTGFWSARGPLSEGRDWLERLLGLELMPRREATARTGDARPPGPPTAAHAKALFHTGYLALWQGDYVAATTYLEAALAMARAVGEQWLVARVLNQLGVAFYFQGQVEQAIERNEESLQVARELGDTWSESRALGNLGFLAYDRGDWVQATARYEEALTIDRTHADPQGAARELGNLGRLALRAGKVQQAAGRMREMLSLVRTLGELQLAFECLEGLAMVHAAEGDGERAACLLGAAAAVRETVSAPQSPPERDEYESALAPARAALGEEAWAAAFASGRALSLEQIIAEALGETT
jgi:tetratricopeptide (TPR) repeat protein